MPFRAMGTGIPICELDHITRRSLVGHDDRAIVIVMIVAGGATERPAAKAESGQEDDKQERGPSHGENSSSASVRLNFHQPDDLTGPPRAFVFVAHQQVAGSGQRKDVGGPFPL